MARLTEELEKPNYTSNGQPEPFSLRREGAGQAVLIGLPNGGKSQLLASLTGAAAKVGSYPITTRVPMPGMVQFENVGIQLVDTPAITDQDMQTRLFSLLRNADLLVIVLDLSTDALAQMDEIIAELEKWGYLLLGRDEEADPEEHRVQKRVIIVGHKADEIGALEQFQRLEATFTERFPTLMVSSLDNVSLDELREAAFLALHKVRVYTKAPTGQPDFDAPILLKRGSAVEDTAQALHKDWRRRLKYALLWGSGKFDGQRVGRDYVVSDGDVLEFHG